MRKLLQVDFNFTAPFTEEMLVIMKNLASSINEESGLVWKIWTQNIEDKLGGGVYLFEDEVSANTYLKMHTARLKQMGITNIRGVIFDINESLTAINNGPV